jgi:hypothetical protein
MARKTNKKAGASASTASLGLEAKLCAVADATSLESDYPASRSHAKGDLYRVAWSGE